MTSVLLFSIAVVGVASAAQIEPSDNTEISRQEPEEFTKKLKYYYYRNNAIVYISNGFNFDKLEDYGYQPGDNITMILHGWTEGCDIEWVKPLIAQFTKHRGGITVCPDYSAYSKGLYSSLLEKFEPIRNAMTDKMIDLVSQNVPLQRLFGFGFSIGGQLAVEIGKLLNALNEDSIIKDIHTCDMAGIGFDDKPGPVDHRGGAENVYCLHTTSIIGTGKYGCHQDVRAGHCGDYQPGILVPVINSHKRCVELYISAFDNVFKYIPKPAVCKSDNPATYIPEDYKMGFMEPRLREGRGEYFIETSPFAPYNVL